MSVGPVRQLKIVARELSALGQYYRNDWSDFDGRTLRDQLQGIAIWMAIPDTDDYTHFSDLLDKQEEESREEADKIFKRLQALRAKK